MAKSQNNNMRNQPEPTQEQIQAYHAAMKHATDITCSCGNTIFVQGIKFKKVSKIVMGTPDDLHFDVPTAICIKCQKELSPEDVQKEEVKSNPDEIILDFKR